MNSIIVLSIVIGSVFAAPALNLQGNDQYHVQDNLGQYNYGYNSELSSKVESKTNDGVTRGAYRYLDSNGEVQEVEYQADDNGFHILRASNIPSPVAALPVPVAEVPVPVEDTPEVAAAKSAHLAAVEEVKARNAAIERNSVETYQQFYYPQPYSLIQTWPQPGFYGLNLPYYYSYSIPQFLSPSVSITVPAVQTEQPEPIEVADDSVEIAFPEEASSSEEAAPESEVTKSEESPEAKPESQESNQESEIKPESQESNEESQETTEESQEKTEESQEITEESQN